MTIDAAAVRGHFQVLLDSGISKKALEDALGLTQNDLEIQDTRVPFLNNLKMLELGISFIRPDMALKLGTSVSLEKLGVCGFIFKNCENLEELTYQFIRYQKLLHSISHYEFLKKQGVLKHSIKYPEFKKYTQLSTELGFSSIVHTIRNLTNKEKFFHELHFSYPQPQYVQEYKEIFRAPLRFNQKENAIFFKPEQFNTPIPQSQPYIKEVLINHANELLYQLETGGYFKNTVQKLVIENLSKGQVDIKMISTKLNMSRWTLTRKLKKEGITFQNLVNEVRKNLAANYLKDTDLSVNEIAFLMGYSEMGAFSRAFKTWTGKNPYSYRKELLSA